jgi:hypothetical protein
MAITNFAKPLNNIATTVAASYTAGSGSLTVASAAGITLTAGQFVRVSTFRQGAPLGILKASAVAGNVLTIAGAIDGYTDVNLLIGDAAELRVTAGAFADIHAAVNALEALEASTVYTTGSYASPGWLTSIAGSIVAGNIAGNAASITGSIAESQVTNLTTDLAAKAADNAVVHLAGTETISGAKTFSASATFQSIPTAPTAAAGTSMTQIATTAFVQSALSLSSGSYYGAPLWLTGQNAYMYTLGVANPGTSNALGTGILRLQPWVVPINITITAIGAEVSSSGDAGCKFRIGLYNDGGQCFPTTLVQDFGTIAGDSATLQMITLGTPLSINAGLYWIGGAVQLVTANQPTMRTYGSMIYSLPSTALPGSGTVFWVYQQTGVTGSLPSSFTSTRTTNSTPAARIIVRLQ